jgi:hypothetical protein
MVLLAAGARGSKDHAFHLAGKIKAPFCNLCGLLYILPSFSRRVHQAHDLLLSKTISDFDNNQKFEVE